MPREQVPFDNQTFCRGISAEYRHSFFEKAAAADHGTAQTLHYAKANLSLEVSLGIDSISIVLSIVTILNWTGRWQLLFNHHVGTVCQ
ncbi:hypothetical protein IF2G_02067 [Cordyceps javanica]|nr:hypothetical protein IF2G_02067 [Cordyceps javanica]